MNGDMNRPDRYALAVAHGSPAQRATLFALSIRANLSCGCVLAGTWLSEAVGLHPGTVRKHLHALADSGIIALLSSPGGALVARFPVGEVVHNPAHQCAGCQEWGRALRRDPPRPTARNPAPQDAPKQKENIYKTAVGSDDGSDLSLAEVRKIWIDARNEGRST